MYERVQADMSVGSRPSSDRFGKDQDSDDSMGGGIVYGS